jgi:hypothetical protein
LVLSFVLKTRCDTIYLYIIGLSVYLSIYLCVYLSIYLSIYLLSIYMSIYICLSIFGLFTTLGPWRTREHRRYCRRVQHHLQNSINHRVTTQLYSAGVTQYSKQRSLHLVSSKVWVWFCIKAFYTRVIQVNHILSIDKHSMV